MSRVFAAYSVGGLIGPALGAFGGIHGPFFAYLALLLACAPARAVRDQPAARRDFDRRPRGAPHARLLGRVRRRSCSPSLALGVLEGVLPAPPRRAAHPSPDRRPLRRRVACRRDQRDGSGGRPPRPLVIAAVVLGVAGIALAGVATERAALGAGAAARRARDRLREHRLARPARRGGAGRADRDRDGRLVADRHHRLHARPADGGIVAEGAATGTFGSSRPLRALLVLVLTRAQVTRA